MLSTISEVERTPPARPIRRGRGRPALIDQRRIVECALELANDGGAGSVTMAAIAERLGVAVPALYYHVESLDEVLTLVAEALLAELPLPDSRLRWDRWLRELADRMRQLLTDQPLLTRLPYLAVHPPFPAETLEVALRVLTRAGFAPDYALVMFSQHVRVIVDLVHAEQAREHERRHGRGQIRELRRIAATSDAIATPILHRVLERWADLPDDRGGYDDVLFEWQINLELAGWRAVLAGDVPTRLLGPPRP